MDLERKLEYANFLDTLPPVEFCSVYGSSIHSNNLNKTSMIDYILGVADPLQWHSENLKINRNHYASWILQLGGARLISGVADHVGVGVHFNPYVSHNGLKLKYGVVRMHDLVQDIIGWERFYLSGRLQKPVISVLDNMKIKELNSVNLRAATAAALLFLPSKFSEEELYAQISNLSYMGDLRMHFAEDKNKVKKIVHGQFMLFQAMYDPFIKEFAASNLLQVYSLDDKASMIQDSGLSSTRSLVSHLPRPIQFQMSIKLGEDKVFNKSGQAVSVVAIRRREECVDCLQKILRRKVMLSSARQAAAGLLTAGAVGSLRYLGSKMHKALKSWL